MDKKYIIAFCISLLLVGGGVGAYFLLGQKGDSQEVKEYEYAMKSSDHSVLEHYLNTYTDAPREHRDSVQTRLTVMNNEIKDWHNAEIENTIYAYQDFLKHHPNSAYVKEATHKVDSIDWAMACSVNTQSAYTTYNELHPDGEHNKEADELIRSLKACTLLEDEEVALRVVYKTFFQGLNMKSEERVRSVLCPTMSKFLGKEEASPDDAVSYIGKLWRDDVKNLNWYINNDYEITKKEIGTDEYEYSVTFTAQLKEETTRGNTETKYRIRSVTNPDMLISEFSLHKIVE